MGKKEVVKGSQQSISFLLLGEGVCQWAQHNKMRLNSKEITNSVSEQQLPGLD